MFFVFTNSTFESGEGTLETLRFPGIREMCAFESALVQMKGRLRGWEGVGEEGGDVT